MAKPRADRRTAGASRERGIIVLTIAGSLVASGRAKSILGILGRARRPIVVVPDGGAGLREAIGQLQSDLGISDAAAHRMAMLAMHQTAMAMADIQPRLLCAETMSTMRRAHAAGRIPVWLPLRMCDRDRHVPADGSMTPDALAARLAERLGAPLVLLVKPRRVRRGATASDLAAQGIIDTAFAQIVGRVGLPFRVLGLAEAATLAEIVGTMSYRGQHPATCRVPKSRQRRSRRPGVRGLAHGKI